MGTWVGLLRAVNVGGRKLAMADLRRIVEESGGAEVRTYLQSGNVVFAATKAVATGLGATLTSYCGFEVPVLLRTGADLQAVVDGQPFTGPTTAWHVTFLDRSPAAGAAAAVDPRAYAGDEFRLAGREIYVRTPGGYGRTKLNNAFWERTCKVTATTRNWKSVEALLAMTRGGG